MKWRTQTVKEGRLKFIHEALQTGLKFVELCFKYNISRNTGYKWLKRFLQDGEHGLLDRSRARKTQSTKLSTNIKQKIIEIKANFSKYGPKKIQNELRKQGASVPSTGSIGNVLKNNGLSKSRNFRRHVARTAPLKDCKAPNDVWMYDFKGYFKTGDGKLCEPFTITDGYSRYLICCQHLKNKTTVEVWKALVEAFQKYGLPTRMRSDNGPPFATIGAGRLSSLSIKLIKAGVMPEWIEPGKPQQNGRHERFHLTLKQEIADPPAATLSLQLAKMEQFIPYYNEIRPHEALGQEPPSNVYRSSKRKWDGELKSPEYTEEFELRIVSKRGNINWHGSTYFITESLYKEPVGLLPNRVGGVEVYYGPILLGEIDYSKGFKKR
jgi:putative transposase